MNLFYKTYGAGEALILIPGFASGAWTWFCQTEELSRDFRVITFDPRGIGSSNNDAQNLSMQTFTKDILRILDDLKIEKTNVLGASFGGFVAQEFALKFPARVENLILACTSAGGKYHIKPDIEILRSFTRNPSLSLSEQIRQFFRPAFTEEFNAETVEKVCQLREENEVSDETYLAQLGVAISFDFEENLDKIFHRTLVITGDKDKIVPMENSLNLSERIPNARLEIIKNGSHLFFIENAKEFNREVSEFLSEPSAIADGLM